jgi:Zn-dependent protease
MQADQLQPQPQTRITGSLSFLTLFGIPIRLHLTFAILLVFLLVVGVSGSQSAATMVLYVLALFGSVLIHEMTHAVVARRYGIRTLEIVMLPFGGVARLERQPQKWEEMWISLAGPAANLVIAGALFAWLNLHHGLVPVEDLTKPSDGNLLMRIAAGNLILALFNLLPAFPMDGGRVLRAILATRRPEHEATRIAARIGMALAALMGLAGLLTMNVMLVFIAFFVYAGASQESVASTGQWLMRGEKVRAAMVTDFKTLHHSDSIRAAADLLLATSQQDFPIYAGDQVAGLLGRAALLRALAKEGPDAYVASCMDRDFVRLSPEEGLAEASTRLTGKGSCALVFENEALLGLLTMENLSEFLVLRRIDLEGRATPRE